MNMLFLTIMSNVFNVVYLLHPKCLTSVMPVCQQRLQCRPNSGKQRPPCARRYDFHRCRYSINYWLYMPIKIISSQYRRRVTFQMTVSLCFIVQSVFQLRKLKAVGSVVWSVLHERTLMLGVLN